MKNKLLPIVFFLFTFINKSDAQIWKRIKQKAEDAITKKAGDEIDKTINGNKKDKKTPETEDQKDNDTNETSEKQEENTNTTSTKEPEELWRNFKFIPGEKIIFYDDLKFEENGEFPSKWDLIKGGVEVAKLGNDKIIYATTNSYNRINPLFENKNYLSDEFTIEFDVYINDYGKYSTDMTKYLISFREESFYVGFNEISIFANRKGITGRVSEGHTHFDFENVPLGETNSWHHISISYYKKKLKVYYDGHRISNLPNFKIPVEKFALDFKTSNKDHKAAIKNIRIAHGGGQMYKRIIADGKYVTNGILFDSGKATIKPQSMGVINKIVNVMNEYPDWNFEIIGHTDSDGNDQANLILSKQRAEAVKQAIIKQGIKTERLSVIGKGETEPLNNNSNLLEKANNRRVEFIKK